MKQGFTLIEVLVAIGIFSVILLIVTGLFTRFLLAQRRDIDEQAVQEDMRLAIELLARETRTAYANTFTSVSGDPDNELGVGLIFRDQNGLCTLHRQHGAVWERAERETSDECDQATYTDFVPLTSPRTKIEYLNFIIPLDIVSGVELNRQGFVTAVLKATSTSTQTPPLELQTTLTSRQVKVYGQE